MGKGIGIVPEDSTASNLGKLVREINFSIVLPKNADYVSAIGAGVGDIYS